VGALRLLMDLLMDLLIFLLILTNRDTLKAPLREKEVAREKETKEDLIGEEEGEEEEAAGGTTVEGVTEEGVDNIEFLFVAL